MKILGFIVNPIAGMGGRVGLKGTDGQEILLRAKELGAQPLAPSRAMEVLEGLKAVKEAIQLVTYPSTMGEEEAKNCGFNPTTMGSVTRGNTTAEDTKRAVRDMMEMGVDLILFVGGDGTARDVTEVAGSNMPILGVPAGVKVHSAIFAVDPRAAARITMRFLWEELPLREAEVMDVDEEAYREGRLSARLYGYALTPYEPGLIQGMKVASPITEIEVYNQAAIATYVLECMNPEVIYIVGPGSTTRIIGDLLGADKTLLGVDLFFNKKIMARDVTEQQILKGIDGKMAKIIVTPIGGQGFIFGRGNQQISPTVIWEVGVDNVVVVATKNKLRGLRVLRIDTGDPELDQLLQGYIRVITDYREDQMFPVE